MSIFYVGCEWRRCGCARLEYTGILTNRVRDHGCRRWGMVIRNLRWTKSAHGQEFCVHRYGITEPRDGAVMSPVPGYGMVLSGMRPSTHIERGIRVA